MLLILMHHNLKHGWDNIMKHKKKSEKRVYMILLGGWCLVVSPK